MNTIKELAKRCLLWLREPVNQISTIPFEFRDFNTIRKDIINEFSGSNFEQLAIKHGLPLTSIHKIIFSADPTRYGQAISSAKYEQTQNISALPVHAHNRHRIARKYGNHWRSGKLKNTDKSCSCRCSHSNKPSAWKT